MDSITWRLLTLLQENARLSFRQLGEMIGLTAPAVAERVRRLEDSGVVSAYRAEIDLPKAGLPILVFVHLACNSQNCTRFRAAAADIPQILECHTVTGVESYILKVAVPSVPMLEHFLLELKEYGDVRTSLVLSTLVKGRIIDEQVAMVNEEE